MYGKIKTNKQTNYYLQERYANAEMNTDKISFAPDSGSYLYYDTSPDAIEKKDCLMELDKVINDTEHIKNIIDKLPFGNKTIYLTVEDSNILYSFVMNLNKTHEYYKEKSKVEIFSILTDYMNLNQKEIKYFYDNLAVSFKTELLNELGVQSLYKKPNRLF